MPDKFGWDNNFGNNPAPTRRQAESFVEETCNCNRVWRGKPGSNPSAGCPDCGEEMAAEHKWRRENHFP